MGQQFIVALWLCEATPEGNWPATARAVEGGRASVFVVVVKEGCRDLERLTSLSDLGCWGLGCGTKLELLLGLLLL